MCFDWRQWWRILCLVLTTCLLAFFIIVIVRFKTQQSIPPPLLAEMKRKAEPFDRFRLLGVSVIRLGDDGRKRLSATAEKILHRNRVGKFFSYYNLKEIDISNLRVELSLKTQPHEGKTGLLGEAFQEINALPASMSGFSPTLAEGKGEQDEGESEVISRALIDRLSLTINVQKQEKIALSAEKALINLHGVTFSGFFSFTAADGKRLTASRAIWVRDSEKISVADGYVLQGKKTTRKGVDAVFLLARNGRLVKSREQSAAMNILGSDWIDDTEARLKSFFLKEMIRQLPSLRVLFPAAAISSSFSAP